MRLGKTVRQRGGEARGHGWNVLTILKVQKNEDIVLFWFEKNVTSWLRCHTHL